MFLSLLKSLFGGRKGSSDGLNNTDISPSEKVAVEAPISVSKEVDKPKKKRPSYRLEVKEKYGFDIPSSDTDKISMGRAFEKGGELEKACACYEGCLKNRFDGNAPYDRLIIIYRKLHRQKDAERVIKKAITVFEKVASQGRSDGPKKLEKFKSQLDKIRQG